MEPSEAKKDDPATKFHPLKFSLFTYILSSIFAGVLVWINLTPHEYHCSERTIARGWPEPAEVLQGPTANAEGWFVDIAYGFAFTYFFASLCKGFETVLQTKQAKRNQSCQADEKKE